MEDNRWMIVRKEKMSTKIKNYFKKFFSKIKKNKKKQDTKIVIEYKNTIDKKTENSLKPVKMNIFKLILTKLKLSTGKIAVNDVKSSELESLIDLYKNRNKELRKHS